MEEVYWRFRPESFSKGPVFLIWNQTTPRLTSGFQLDMKTALTPDQQAKLKELMQSRRPGMRGPGGPNGPQGGPGRGGRGPRPPQGSGTGTSDPADGTIS